MALTSARPSAGATTAQAKDPARAPLPLTSRRDRWWIRPLIVCIVLGTFVLYSTFRAFENQYYQIGSYLTPFYSPLLPFDLRLAGWRISPAIYILIFPLSFRLTCYYYRLAYYRAFFWDPPACAVREPGTRKHYTGERAFPLIVHNLHRYTFYAAAVFVVILGWDALISFFAADGVHLGLGSLLLVANAVLIGLYTFSCHSWRHLIGGQVNCYSCTLAGRTRFAMWKKVTYLNERHAWYAWLSLFSILIADLYIRLLASGVISDPRIF